MDDFIYQASRDGGRYWKNVPRVAVARAICADPAQGPEQVQELLWEMRLHGLEPVLDGVLYRAHPAAAFPTDPRARRLRRVFSRAMRLSAGRSPLRREQLLELARRAELALRAAVRG